MVQKFSKYGLNTGNTIRKGAWINAQKENATENRVTVSIENTEHCDDEELKKAYIKGELKKFHWLHDADRRAFGKTILQKGGNEIIEEIEETVSKNVQVTWSALQPGYAEINLNKDSNWTLIDQILHFAEYFFYDLKYRIFPLELSENYNVVVQQHHFYKEQHEYEPPQSKVKRFTLKTQGLNAFHNKSQHLSHQRKNQAPHVYKRYAKRANQEVDFNNHFHGLSRPSGSLKDFLPKSKKTQWSTLKPVVKFSIFHPVSKEIYPGERRFILFKKDSDNSWNYKRPATTQSYPDWFGFIPKHPRRRLQVCQKVEVVSEAEFKRRQKPLLRTVVFKHGKHRKTRAEKRELRKYKKSTKQDEWQDRYNVSFSDYLEDAYQKFESAKQAGRNPKRKTQKRKSGSSPNKQSPLTSEEKSLTKNRTDIINKENGEVRENLSFLTFAGNLLDGKYPQDTPVKFVSDCGAQCIGKMPGWVLHRKSRCQPLEPATPRHPVFLTETSSSWQQSPRIPAPPAGPKPNSTTKNAWNRKLIQPNSSVKPKRSKEQIKLQKERLNKNQLHLKQVEKYALDPINVKVKLSTLSVSSLVKRFGSAYAEGCSNPRKLWINLNGVKSNLQHEMYLCLTVSDLVQTQQDNNKKEIIQFSLVSVLLKTGEDPEVVRSMQRGVKLKLRPHFLYPLSKVVQAYITVIESSQNKNEITTNQMPSPASLIGGDIPNLAPPTDFDWLYALCGWSLQVFTTNDAYQILNRGSGVSEQNNTSQRVARTPSPSQSDQQQLACQCCDVVITAGETATARGTALKACGHWFCTSCWQLHLVESLRTTGQTVLKCPDKECQEPVDSVTLLHLMPLAFYKWYQGMLQAAASHQLQWRWCPRPQCGRAIKLCNTDKPSTFVCVQCPCDQRWCFSCLLAPHWPASCHQFSQYQQTIQHTGALLETSGAQAVMVLKSAAGSAPSLQLCSSCLLMKMGVQQQLGVQQVDISEDQLFQVQDLRSSLFTLACYKRALQHRWARERWSVAQAESKAANIARQIQRSKTQVSHQKLSDRGRSLTFLSRPVSRTASRLYQALGQETERFFLNVLFKFINQAHYLLEYSLVLMMSCSSDKAGQPLMQDIGQLEAIIEEITQIVDSGLFCKSTMSVLQQLHESGQVAVRLVVKRAQELQESMLTAPDQP